MKTCYVLLAVMLGLFLLIWLGLRIKPRPFPSYSDHNRTTPAVLPMSADLPVPVARFYEVIYGDSLPLINSFIISGRGRLRFNGITFPARLRFTHNAGKEYRHYIETTFWGIPILNVNEHYLGGKSRLALPFGVIENEPQVDQAANLGLWSETLMFPSVFLTTDQVRWEEIDATTARLMVPFHGEFDSFIVYFNPETGLVDYMETMRWKNAGDLEKSRWQAQALAWGEVEGWLMPVRFAAQWMDEKSPWLIADIEDVVWNVDISHYIQDIGP